MEFIFKQPESPLVSCRHGAATRAAPIGKRSGTIISTPYDGSAPVFADTVQCCHCAYTSLWVKGSEKWWSLCTRCNQLRCGRVICRGLPCVYKELVLDNMDYRGLLWHEALEFQPIISRGGFAGGAA